MTLTFNHHYSMMAISLLASIFSNCRALANNNLYASAIRYDYESESCDSTSKVLISAKYRSGDLKVLAAMPTPLRNSALSDALSKHEDRLIAQLGSIQEVVNVISRLRKQGRINVDKRNTYYFGDRKGQYTKVSTTGADRGDGKFTDPFANLITIIRMPARSGYTFRILSNNSYQFNGSYFRGEYTACPAGSNCPIFYGR